MDVRKAYLIIQEFPKNEVEFVIGTKPFGIIWHNYEEANERYNEVVKEWESDSRKNKGSKPKLVKIDLHLQ